MVIILLIRITLNYKHIVLNQQSELFFFINMYVYSQLVLLFILLVNIFKINWFLIYIKKNIFYYSFFSWFRLNTKLEILDQKKIGITMV